MLLTDNQFFTLCLLNLYFAQVMFKAKAKYSPELNKYKVPLRLAFLFASLFFLVVNITCAMLVQGSAGDGEEKHAVLARVLINDSLFVLCAVSLAVCIFRIAKMSSANVYLESKGTSVCQATAIGAAVILLYTSRACYNLVVVALSPEDRPSPFNYGWYNVSDQADVEKISGEAYIVFGIILFFWELLPTSLVVVFFRVQRPNQNLAPGGMINSHSFSSRAYFFDNPRRYDSDDDLSRSITSRGDRGSSIQSSTPQPGPSWYGSIQRNGSLTGVPHLLNGPQSATRAPAPGLRQHPDQPAPQLLLHAPKLLLHPAELLLDPPELSPPPPPVSLVTQRGCSEYLARGLCPRPAADL
ncbi:hypothetical protein SKAU_G00334140 [Synaphobranchus kaupii]|uniref:Integral membrane protein GPR137C n=1 Tax=Synaphobranchus kaupii TaxID=118154 RepID=A0A9Q1ELR5_SYNKA|nr:hypothetical protein SKAU_G00334140 [Synaphobranchus kaupii]